MKYIFNDLDIKGQRLINATRNFLIEKYNQSKLVFTYAGSFGQILLVVQNLFKTMLTYLQHVASEKNIETATLKHNIYGMARISGHDPSTSRSSRGTASIKWDASKISGTVPLPIYITNYTTVECVENTLKYTLVLSRDYELLGGDNGKAKISSMVVQGQPEKKEFVGTGTNLQSFNVAGENIDKDTVTVEVNGSIYDKYESLYDIPFGDKGCIIKTGINGGIDIYFGTDVNTQIPPLGATIIVDYITNDGVRGNIENIEYTTLRFIDEGVDGNGNIIDLNEYLEIKFSTPPLLGADSEPTELTKLLTPMYNKNRIIHDGNSLMYFLTKMNLFSSINVVPDTNMPNSYDVYLTPKLVDVFTNTTSYFSSDLSKFTVSDEEISAINRYMYQSGRITTNMNVRFLKPTIKKYVLYIIVNMFDFVGGIPLNETEVKTNIAKEVEAHLINNPRPNRISISDLIGKIESVDFVDSLRIIPVGEAQEIARINGLTDIIGFDNTGDIEVKNNEIPVIRGGWSDRDGNNYTDILDVNINSHTSLNIITNKIIVT